MSTEQKSILQHLPLWGHRTCPVTAARALVLPSEDWIFPGLPSSNLFVADEPKHVQKLIQRLGGTILTRHEYVLDYIVPHLPDVVEIPLVQNIHNFIVSNLPSWPEHAKLRLSTARLIPDRNGKLQYPSSLYDSYDLVFASAFASDDSAFPHTDLNRMQSNNLGVNWQLTKEAFIKAFNVWTTTTKTMTLLYGGGRGKYGKHLQLAWDALRGHKRKLLHLPRIILCQSINIFTTERSHIGTAITGASILSLYLPPGSS